MKNLGIALTLVLATAAMGFADNLTPGTARSIAMNSTAQDFLESGSRTSVWYKVQLFASRSYQISVWTVREDGVFVNIDPVELYSDPAGTALVSSGVTTTDSAFEGSPNDANLGSRTTIFQPTATGVYLIHAGTDTAALAATKVNIRVRETTLFSPWTSRAAGFEGFIEIHNNTSAAVSVTLRAFNNVGASQGAGLTFAVPANATEFKTATQVGVPVGTFAGLVLTHDGAFGAISGNITTLNGANGLSFDSAFTPREFAAGGGSDSSATSGPNSDITSLTGLTTPLSVGQGGTGQSTAAAALTALGGASSGVNSNITSLTGLTTPLSVGQGGTGRNALALNGIVVGQGTGAVGTAVGVAGQVLAGTAGAPVWTPSPSLSGNLTLVTPSTATTGNIMKGANRFIHNFGTGNTFIGVNAGNFGMTGVHNTASGLQAFFSNTTGNSNTASGLMALFSNTTGAGNTASGSLALQSNTTGNRNTASSSFALSGNTTGDDNTASGSQALASNSTGSGNTAIGSFANVGAGDLTNATAIGYGATVNASNKIRLGNTAVTVIEGQVAYTFPSDRTRKENFRNVDDQKVLEKLREMSVTTWNYIGHDPKEFRHYGPMAQDFFAAFGRDEVGAIGTETTINSGDITAILMLGLKGLDQQVQKDQRTIEAQGAEIASLKQQTARIAALEESRQALAAELILLKAQVGRIASQSASASSVIAPATKGAGPIGK